MNKVKHGAHRKFDLDLAKSFFVAGMSQEDIIKQPGFETMSIKYLRKVSWEEKWTQERKTALAAAAGMVSNGCVPTVANLIKKKSQHIEEHYSFMFGELESFRKLIEAERKQSGPKHINIRMGMVSEYNDLATKVLGLNENPAGDDNSIGFAFLSAIHTAQPGTAPMLAIFPKLPEKIAQASELPGQDVEPHQNSNQDQDTLASDTPLA